MRIELTQPQSEFYASNAKYVAAVAGYGSGKTEVALTKLLGNMRQQPGIDQAYLAPTFPLIRDIFYPKAEKFLSDLRIPYVVNKGENNIHVNGLGTIFCRSMENPANIIGWEAADIVLDEFDILPYNKAMMAFRKASARLRQKNPCGRKNQLYITTTPEGYKATYELFKKNPLPRSHLIQMSTYSNAHNLPDDYIEELLAQYPPQLIRAYLRGEFVNLTSGSVYPDFDRELNDTHYVAAPREMLHVGMDFNVNAMFAVIHVIRHGKAYAVDELVDVADTPTMCKLLNEFYEDHSILVYPDASGNHVTTQGVSKSDIKMLKQAGFRVNVPGKNPFIRDRINSVNARINDHEDNRHYFVNQRRCPTLVECFEQQPYDKNGVPDKDGGLDHGPDAAGYFIHKRWPLDRLRTAYYNNPRAQWK